MSHPDELFSLTHKPIYQNGRHFFLRLSQLYQNYFSIILNIQLVDMAMRDAFEAWYMGSVSLEMLPLTTALRFLYTADIVIVMHGAGHSLAAAFMREGSWLLEVSWPCRGKVLRNTGKVIKGRKVNQKNYVLTREDLLPVPRGYLDAGSQYVGSFFSGVSTAPRCENLYPVPFRTLYGNADFGFCDYCCRGNG